MATNDELAAVVRDARRAWRGTLLRTRAELHLHQRQLAQRGHFLEIVQRIEQRRGLLGAELAFGAVENLLAQLGFGEPLLPVTLRAHHRRLPGLVPVPLPEAPTVVRHAPRRS